MKLKNLYKISKINIYNKNIISFMEILSTILATFCLPILLLFITLFVFGVANNFDTDSFVFFLAYILFNFSIILVPIFFMTEIVKFLFKKIIVKATYNKLNFNIPESKTNILTHLIYRKHKNNKTHTSSNLNLEIEKLSRAFDNKSNIYKNLSETDFPYINKFIRRAILAQSDCKLSNSSNLEQLELISPADPADIGKLNMDLSKVIPSNPKLLTLDSMDNELNNIIHNQMKNLNKENVQLN
jgi:hypothetical protein